MNWDWRLVSLPRTCRKPHLVILEALPAGKGRALSDIGLPSPLPDPDSGWKVTVEGDCRALRQQMHMGQSQRDGSPPGDTLVCEAHILTQGPTHTEDAANKGRDNFIPPPRTCSILSISGWEQAPRRKWRWKRPLQAYDYRLKKLKNKKRGLYDVYTNSNFRISC